MVRKEEENQEAALEDPLACITRYIRERWPRYAENSQSSFPKISSPLTPRPLPSMDELRSFGQLIPPGGDQSLCPSLCCVSLSSFWEEVHASLWGRLRDNVQTLKRKPEGQQRPPQRQHPPARQEHHRAAKKREEREDMWASQGFFSATSTGRAKTHKTPNTRPSGPP